jgi:hypothetical protein
MSSRRPIFHPLAVLLFSLGGAAVYAAWVSWRFPPAKLTDQYVYVVPIVVPFTAFLIDRMEQGRSESLVALVVDAAVVVTAMMRVIGNVPYVSGHALFLTYAVLRRGSLVTRLTAALVMVEVLYLKFFAWHDFITPVTGMMLAAAAALITRRFGNGAAIVNESGATIS